MRNTLGIAVLVLLVGCNGAAGGPNGKTTAASSVQTFDAPAAPGQITPKTLNASQTSQGSSTGTPWKPGQSATPGNSGAGGTSNVAGTPVSQSTSSVTANGTTTTTVSGTPSTYTPPTGTAPTGTANPGLPALSGSTPGTTGTGTAPTGTASSLPPALAGSLPGSTGTAPAPAPSSSTGTGSAPSDSHVAYALNAINASRATKGLPPYTLDPSMSSCALRHSQDCFNCAGGQGANFGNCAHKDFMNGDTCGGGGENQGWGGPGDQDQAFQSVHDGMMSEGPGGGHYDNLMSTTFTSVGIGLYLDPAGQVWITEEFK